MTKKLKPMHPGEVLREEFLVPLALLPRSAACLARELSESPTSRPALQPIPHFGSPRRSVQRRSFG